MAYCTDNLAVMCGSGPPVAKYKVIVMPMARIVYLINTEPNQIPFCTL